MTKYLWPDIGIYTYYFSLFKLFKKNILVKGTCFPFILVELERRNAASCF